MARRIVEQALSSFFQHSELDQAIRLDPRDPEAGWAALGTLNLELGYRYPAGALIAESAPEDEQDARTFVPSARPCARMPHAWVGSGIHRRST